MSVLEPVLDNLGNLSVSRSTDRRSIGIPVPGDQPHNVSLPTDTHTYKLGWFTIAEKSHEFRSCTTTTIVNQ